MVYDENLMSKPWSYRIFITIFVISAKDLFVFICSIKISESFGMIKLGVTISYVAIKCFIDWSAAKIEVIMNLIIQECIKRINTNSALQGKSLGFICRDLLFPYNKRALVFDTEQQLYYILTNEENVENDRRIITELLSELLNVLDFLLKEHLIYFIKDSSEDFKLYYQLVERVNNTQFEHKYDCDNGIMLSVEDSIYTLSSNGNKLLVSSIGENMLYEKLYFWLTSSVFPTLSLNDYIKRGFVTEEKFIANQSLKISEKSLFLAFAVAVLTPIATLVISNLWGVTKVDSEQFDILKEIVTKHDTTTIIIRDSICLIPLKESLEQRNQKK
ncbi:hypothetical protein [Parabacteroides johnsonii]|uniref:hypothetical protein n=1 Tax=Parabacteroides johnsonii TaxID=387661 RepID=UPI001897293A|nr:hypothetical protein [Parabacteroides johnsonii]